MGARARSPSAERAAGPAAQPAKRPRCQEPDDLDPPALPCRLREPAPAPDAGPQVSVVLLAPGWALCHDDLVLAPPPDQLLRVCLPGHTLVLVPQENLARCVELRAQGGQRAREAAAPPDACRDVGAMQLGPFPASALPLPLAAAAAVAPTLAFQRHLHLELVQLEQQPAAARRQDDLRPGNRRASPPQLWPWGRGLSPHGSPGGPCFSLRLHQLRPRLDSALQPLPASSGSGAHWRPRRPAARPRCKARRRLFC